MDYSLSNIDIKRLLDNKVKIITHDKIKDYNDINDLLKPYNKVVILYRNSYNYGHWTCLFRNKNGINFFDSYGNKPDGILKFLPKNLKKSLEQDHKKLIELLYKSGENVYYNEYPLQEISENINTCGRWCVFRLMLSYMDEYEFYNLFKKYIKDGYSPDEIITYITGEI